MKIRAVIIIVKKSYKSIENLKCIRFGKPLHKMERRMVKNVYNDIFDNSKRKAWIRDHLECSETKEYEIFFVKCLQGYL